MSLETVIVRTSHTADLDERVLSAARALLYDVFDDMTEHDWEHCLGGMHAIAFEGDEVIGHAALVQRRLLHGGRVLRAGYVEGVAVRADRRRCGIGGAVMAPLERIIRSAYEIGALGATDEAAVFYASRGWRLWEGRTSALTPRGIVRTPDEDGCIHVFPASVSLSPDLDLACDWRDGDVW